MSASAEVFAEEPLEPPPPGGGGLARNTAIFAFLTGFSRIVGLLREIVFAAYFGTTNFASAYSIASQVPNFVANLFAQSALSAAFVPVFTDLLQKGRRQEAMRLASTLFWILLIGAGALTALFVLTAGEVMPLFIGSKLAAQTHLIVGLSRVLFPIVLLLALNGLRVSEACDLRWDDIDLRKRTIIVRRLKGSTDSVHYLERDELNGLKLLHRQQQANGTRGAYVFINERGQPFGRMGIGRMIEIGRASCRERV